MTSSQCIWNFIGVALLLQLSSVLAVNGTATQSSTHFFRGRAYLAVDGNASPDYVRDKSCTFTGFQDDPWWRMELPAVHRVTVVEVTGRVDCCCERLDGAKILIGNSQEDNGSNNPRCGVISVNPLTRQTYSFQCEMEGRFVYVFLPGVRRLLTLYEVKVYGEPIPPPPSVSMLLGGRTVTVVGKSLCWSDALLYCRASYSDLLSLHSREEQREVQGLLGRASFPLTSHLWLGLRRYLMGDRWFWMSGNHMNYSQWEGGSAPVKPCSPCGGVANGNHFLWEDRSCDEHFHFICYTGPKEVPRVDFYTHTLRP